MKVKRQHRNLSHEWADVQICTNIQNGKLDSICGSTQSEIRVASKKALNKSCSKLNFAQKSPQANMSISSWSEARGLERFPSLKNNNVQKWGNRFSLGLDITKNTHHIKKSFK